MGFGPPLVGVQREEQRSLGPCFDNLPCVLLFGYFKHHHSGIKESSRLVNGAKVATVTF